MKKAGPEVLLTLNLKVMRVPRPLLPSMERKLTEEKLDLTSQMVAVAEEAVAAEAEIEEVEEASEEEIEAALEVASEEATEVASEVEIEAAEAASVAEADLEVAVEDFDCPANN